MTAPGRSFLPADGRDRSWMVDAACRGADTDLWFPVDGDALGRKLCQECPVKLQCLEYALGEAGGVSEDHGTWGGVGEKERRRMRRQSRGTLRSAAASRRAAHYMKPQNVPATAMATRLGLDVRSVYRLLAERCGADDCWCSSRTEARRTTA